MNLNELKDPTTPASRRRLLTPREGPQRLTFAPRAWLKLQWFLHAGQTEVGGFGVSAEHDPLYVEDFLTVLQRTTAVTVAFDDAAVADLYDAMVDAGLPPARFARLWIHTHPGDSPHPSGTDEETFARAFGACDWAVMFIASRTGRTYARLRFSAGPGGDLVIPVDVDWGTWPQALADADGSSAAWASLWKAEFDRNVQPRSLTSRRSRGRRPETELGWDVDLLLGQGWPWDDREGFDLGQSSDFHDVSALDELRGPQVLEADLVRLFEAEGSLDERNLKEVIHDFGTDAT